MDTQTIGKRVRQIRKMKGITQGQLASLTGLSTMSIRRYEGGERIITEDTLQRISEALEVPVWELLDHENSVKFREEFAKNLPVQPDCAIPNEGTSDLDLAIYNALKSLTVRDKEMLAVMVEHMLATPQPPPTTPEDTAPTPAAPPPESPEEGE